MTDETMTDETTNDEQTPEEIREEVLAMARAFLHRDDKGDTKYTYLDEGILAAAGVVIQEEPRKGFEILAAFEDEVTRVKGELYGMIAGTDGPQSARSLLEAMTTQELLDKNLRTLREVEKRLASDTLTSATDPQRIEGGVEGDHLCTAFQNVEYHDNRVAFLAMNAREYADLRKFGRDIHEVESRVPFLKQGLMATIWGGQIITSRAIPAGTFLAVGDLENVFPDGLDGSLNPQAVSISYVTRVTVGV